MLLGGVEEAIQLGADAVSVHVNLGSATEAQQLADLGRVAERCSRWGVPLLAMIYPRGPRITDPSAEARVAHAGRAWCRPGPQRLRVGRRGRNEPPRG